MKSGSRRTDGRGHTVATVRESCPRASCAKDTRRDGRWGGCAGPLFHKMLSVSSSPLPIDRRDRPWRDATTHAKHCPSGAYLLAPGQRNLKPCRMAATFQHRRWRAVLADRGAGPGAFDRKPRFGGACIPASRGRFHRCRFRGRREHVESPVQRTGGQIDFTSPAQLPPGCRQNHIGEADLAGL